MTTRKEEIRNCAAKLFRKKGYQATSMRGIAEAVGIKAASIYNHYKSKEEILSDTLLMIANLFTEGMSDIKSNTQKVDEQLEKLISLHVRLAVEYTDAVALITNEWVHLDDLSKKKYLELRDSYELSFKKVIEEGIKQKQLKNLNVEIILFSILSTLRWLYSWYSRNQKEFNQVELEREIKECLLRGIQ